jgi:acetyl esterase/lipase
VLAGGREILVRCYVPEGAGPFPGHLYLHGGAFWAGSVADYDPLCRWYADAAGCVVAAVGYHLAPQHKYPVQVEQACAALRWLAQNAAGLGVRADRISVGGTSSGGALATAVALMARDGTILDVYAQRDGRHPAAAYAEPLPSPLGRHRYRHGHEPNLWPFSVRRHTSLDRRR